MFNVLLQRDMVSLSQLIYNLAIQDLSSRNAGLLVKGIKDAAFVTGDWSTSINPAFLAFVLDDQLVILITGSSNVSQGSCLYAGATGTRAAVGAASMNGCFAVGGVELVKRVLRSVRNAFVEVVLAGHSYGAGFAHAAAAFMTQWYPQFPCQLYSTGCPRPGDNTLSAALEKVTCVRIMTDGDPVVKFPPHFDEAPLGTIAVGFPAALAFSEYSQGPGGRIVDLRGSLRAAELPAWFPPVADANLVVWLGTNLGEGHPEHRLPTYIDRLSRGLVTFGPPVPTQSAGLKGEVATPLPQDIFNLGPVLGPPAFVEYEKMAGETVYIPPEHRAKGQKLGSGYIVLWEGIIISRAPSLSKAKTTAKYLNRFLRTLQNSLSFEATDFNTALVQYMTLASSGTGGFQPNLTVNF